MTDAGRFPDAAVEAVLLAYNGSTAPLDAVAKARQTLRLDAAMTVLAHYASWHYCFPECPQHGEEAGDVRL